MLAVTTPRVSGKRRHRPQDDPGDQRRLADAVARGDGHAHGLVGGVAAVEQAVPDRVQHLALPRLRAALVGQRRARDAPGEGVQDEAQRIVAEGADLAMERRRRNQRR